MGWRNGNRSHATPKPLKRNEMTSTARLWDRLGRSAGQIYAKRDAKRDASEEFVGEGEANGTRPEGTSPKKENRVPRGCGRACPKKRAKKQNRNSPKK